MAASTSRVRSYARVGQNTRASAWAPSICSEEAARTRGEINEPRSRQPSSDGSAARTDACLSIAPSSSRPPRTSIGRPTASCANTVDTAPASWLVMTTIASISDAAIDASCRALPSTHRSGDPAPPTHTTSVAIRPLSRAPQVGSSAGPSITALRTRSA